jgi:signal transduction histidine kinase
VTRIERDGETLAVLIHDPVDLVEDPNLVEAVGSVARLALENERLSAQVRAQLEEVRASRERIIEAGDAERRRVERDLHDGAQQRLVALAMRLQTARKTTPGAEALLDEATAELQTAVAEVRGLARGLHPTILTELGLAAAVDALAERTPIPVSVDIPETRFPEAVEATAYYVVAEAITNMTRYAEARTARVTATVEDDHLVTVVQDDGRGGADATRGSGLRGLADRVAAVRGRLEVLSPIGVGTTIRVELPLT